MLGYASLGFLLVLILIVFYKNRSYLGLGSNSNVISVEANKKNGEPRIDSLKPNKEVDISLMLVSPFSEAKAREVQKEAAKRLQTEVETKADLGKEINLEMVLIPAGKFMMGSPASEKGRRDNENQHEVTLTKPFYMGKYEVTQEQWESVMGKNPSKIKGAKLPVTNVTWLDCQKFIKKLNEKNTGTYRLPTEAEWEYSCRAGTTTVYSFGERITKDDANWGAAKMPDNIKVVGNYKANAFGLFDMHGNVWEWCEDFKSDYLAEAVRDPKGPAKGTNRVLRGGSFANYEGALNIRSSYRLDYFAPSYQDKDFGFRLAMTADIQTGAPPTAPKPDPTLVKPTTEGLLVSPFTEAKAREVQKEAAKRLQKEVEEKVDLGAGIKLDMVLIPTGKFMMGSPVSEKGRRQDETQHEVTLTKPFYMGKYEVTQEQWVEIMGNNPSDTKGAKLPVTAVSWEDCQEFIKKLNAKTNGRYRLPTEAEWECACRAGTTTVYSFGTEITPKDANYGGSTIGAPAVTGSYKSNAFGLYDMHGNVWEWCQDWKADYSMESVIDPKGPATSGGRVLRGGSYWFESTVRSSSRADFPPTSRNFDFGFRLAKTP